VFCQITVTTPRERKHDVVEVRAEADGDVHIALQDATGENPGIVVVELQQNRSGVRDTGRSCDLTATMAYKHIDTIKKRCEDE